MGQVESSEDSSVRYWPGSDGSGGVKFTPMAMARRLLAPGAAAPAADSTQLHSDTEEVGPVMHEAVNWLVRSRGASGPAGAQGGHEGRVPVQGSDWTPLHGPAGPAADAAAADMSFRRDVELEPLRPLLRAELDAPADPRRRHRRSSVPATIWYAQLDEEDQDQDAQEDLAEEDDDETADGLAGAAMQPGAASRRRFLRRRRARRLSDQLSEGAVPQWLHQLSSWVHLTPNLSRSAAGAQLTSTSGVLGN